MYTIVWMVPGEMMPEAQISLLLWSSKLCRMSMDGVIFNAAVVRLTAVVYPCSSLLTCASRVLISVFRALEHDGANQVSHTASSSP